MIKKFFTNRVVYNSIILFIFTFILEMMVRFFTNVSFGDWAVFRIALASLIMSISWSFIGHFFNKATARVFNIIYVLFVGIIEFVEFGLFNYLGFFMGVGNSDQGTKVLGYINDFIHSLKLEYWTILLPTILFFVFYLTLDKMILKNKKRNTEMNMAQKIYIEVLTVFIIGLLCLAHYGTVRADFMQNDLQTEDNYYVWLLPDNPNLSVSNFGVASFLFSDIRSQIKGYNSEYIMALEAENNKKEENKKDNNKKDEPLTPEEVDLKRNINDDAWNLLIKNTTSGSTEATLNNYYINREVYDKNEMTGIFKDKNLIVILMESVNEISILNEEYFPTLHKIYNEGISFRNNFSPRNNCSTGNNELTVLSSLFTINNTCTANTYANNNYFEGAFNIFRNAGYYTTGYHDYTLKYYWRNKYMPNLGAHKFYSVKDLGIPYDDKYEEWPDDADLFKESKKYYMDKDKFFSYFATVSTHQTYNVSSTLGDKYRDKYEKLGYSKTLSRYLSKMQVLDEALAELLKELEDAGKLDDTVIALFGDHFPYGLTDAQVNEFLKKNNAGYTINRTATTDKNVDRTPLVIYNSKTEPKQIYDYSTIIDLLPTLFNMFDLEFDPRLYLGTDIFSDAHQSRAVFADGSWQDENGFYYAPSSKMTYVKDPKHEYTISELKGINKEISTRQKMSASTIKSNYFKYLEAGLKKYQAEIDKQKQETTTVPVYDNNESEE